MENLLIQSFLIASICFHVPFVFLARDDEMEHTNWPQVVGTHLTVIACTQVSMTQRKKIAQVRENGRIEKEKMFIYHLQTEHNILVSS